METKKVKQAAYTAAGAAFGSWAGAALGGLLLGNLGRSVGQVAGALTGGMVAWELSGDDPSKQRSEPETPHQPAVAKEEAPPDAVDAVFFGK